MNCGFLGMRHQSVQSGNAEGEKLCLYVGMLVLGSLPSQGTGMTAETWIEYALCTLPEATAVAT
jgi:hypothetical protein